MTTARQWWHAPAKASPRRLASRLTASLGLTGAASFTVERTYLDTFDWRLYRRGDALVEEATERDSPVLVLRNRAGERAELRVPCAGRPRQPSDLPVGLQRRLGPKLAPRTLLEVGYERVEVWPLRLLDDDDKTVAYIDVERAPAAVRVALRPVRGYEKNAAHLTALLNSQADLVDGVDPMVAAVRFTGREPGELLEPPELKLDPDDDARVALAKVFEHLLATMELTEEGVRQQVDPELLHDFRVATRRMRSIERLASDHLPSEMHRLWEQEWRWLAGVTGPPRDLDVMLLELQLERPMLATSTDAGMHELAARVRARRAVEQVRLLDALNGNRYATLKQGWRAGIEDLRTTSTDGATAEQLARETINAATRHLMKAAKKIHEDAPAEDIHKARKRAKRLRYAAEMLGGALSAHKVKAVITHMKRLQDDLGQFQDSEVQIHLVRDLLEDALLGKPSDNALAAGELMVEDLAQRQQVARGDLVKALREFARS
jgi:CHAD domain-containing protein